MSASLRPYQIDAYRQLRAGAAEHRCQVYCLPTGGGKSTVAAHLASQAIARSRAVLFVAHRRELIHQAAERMRGHGLRCGIIMGDHSRDPLAPVQVGSIQTLTRRHPPPAHLIIVDECHRTLGASYIKLLAKYPDAHVIGLSATPYRTDGRGLGEFYSGLVQGPSPADLVEQGYLVSADIYSPPVSAMLGAHVLGGDYNLSELEQRMNSRALVGDLVDHWTRLAAGRPTVAFAVSVAHSQAIAEAFRAAGVCAQHLDGETPHDERAGMLADLAAGRLDMVTNCAVLTEGWDSPAVSCAIIARPTLSRGLWRQMAGRVLRTYPGKTNAILLDHGGCARLHGHVMDPDPVTLNEGTGPVSKPTEKSPTMTATCPACFGVMMRTASLVDCPYCGAKLVKPRPPIRTKRGSLERVERNPGEPLVRNPVKERALAKARELWELARIRSYKPGWIRHRLAAIYGHQLAERLIAAVRAEARDEAVAESVARDLATGT